MIVAGILAPHRHKYKALFGGQRAVGAVLSAYASMSKRPEWANAPWYHGRLDRVTTETVLVGKRPGLYLVRDSTTCLGDFVLSVSENSKVSHYIISRRGGMYLIGDQSFPDLPSIIDFYKKHFLDTTTLIEVAPRPMASQPPPMASAPVPDNSVLPPPQPVLGKLIVKGKFDFKSDDPEDLHFKKGDILYVLRKDEEEWWFAKHQDGRTGSIPVPYVQVIEDHSQSFYAKALMDRECPYDQTALSFKAGDMIKVTKQNENGMWEGELNGRRGHFPFKLVEVIETRS